MAKALKSFYWKGLYYEVGSNAPSDAPRGFIELPKEEKKTTTKNGKPKKLEDKNRK